MGFSLFTSVFLALVSAGLVLRYWPKLEEAYQEQGARALRYLLGFPAVVALAAVVDGAVHLTKYDAWDYQGTTTLKAAELEFWCGVAALGACALVYMVMSALRKK